MNIGEFISQIRTSNKWLFDDDLITDRHIFNVGRRAALMLIKQEVNKRRLLNSDNIFTSLECENLEMVDATECGIDSNNKVRRSQRLPELEEGIFGYTIQGVFNLINSEEIYPTTVREHINTSKLRFKADKLTYIIKDRMIYVMDKDIECINIYIYLPDNTSQLSDCQSMYDGEIKIPGYLEKGFYDTVNQELINMHKVMGDMNDNNVDKV